MERVAGLGVRRAQGEGKSFWMTDEFMRCLVTAEETGGAYTVIESTVPPGGGPPPHIHTREEEGFWIVAGELELMLDGEISTAGPGTYIHLPKNVVHTFRTISDVPATFLTILVPAGLEAFFEDLGIPSTDVANMPPIQPETIERLMSLAPEYGLQIVLPEAAPE